MFLSINSCHYEQPQLRDYTIVATSFTGDITPGTESITPENSPASQLERDGRGVALQDC